MGVLQNLSVLVPVYFACLCCNFLPTSEGELLPLSHQLVFGPLGGGGGGHGGEGELITEITAGGAVLLHELALAVAIAFSRPGWTDK